MYTSIYCAAFTLFSILIKWVAGNQAWQPLVLLWQPLTNYILVWTTKFYSKESAGRFSITRVQFFLNQFWISHIRHFLFNIIMWIIHGLMRIEYGKITGWLTYWLINILLHYLKNFEISILIWFLQCLKHKYLFSNPRNVLIKKYVLKYYYIENTVVYHIEPLLFANKTLLYCP